ncbi:MAG TPA: DUF1501 domain-containing protein [Roseimicrobium sp.]|nr:DUF1501 domain-containing protein [Roseimicrobium sp.]
MNWNDYERMGWCGGRDHVSRRTLLKAAGLAGLTWLTPLGQALALDAEQRKGKRPRSVIILWCAGAPSQLETFDPHPNSKISYGTKAINTSLKDVQLAAGLEHTAEVMEHVSLIRSVVSKEGDHERASYNMKTGYRPNPTIIHPSLGAIIAHEMPDQKIEIPTHISILPGQWPARGGYLGAAFDAFKLYDPAQQLPDVTSRVPQSRQDVRLAGLNVVEGAFSTGRQARLDDQKTLHQLTTQKALKMMSSEQVKAFDVMQETASERAAFGDTPFGRGCLAALRLVEKGVRCIEVTLDGWDTHANNHKQQAARVAILDPAFAALIKGLKARNLFDDTIVLCGGEFGRTPKLNPVEGRDHWPHGFSLALAGGGIKSGRVIGETDPTGEKKEPSNPVHVEDIHATILHALGIPFEKKIMTAVGRPIALSDGVVVDGLLS